MWSGDSLGKCCGLGLVGFPRRDTFLSPKRRFPFMLFSMESPTIGLDYHLVHTLIPKEPLFEQSRSFPQQSESYS